jgi:hypothetical protein
MINDGGQILCLTGRKVIDDDNFESLFEQRMGEVRADESGAAGDEAGG